MRYIANFKKPEGKQRERLDKVDPRVGFYICSSDKERHIITSDETVMLTVKGGKFYNPECPVCGKDLYTMSKENVDEYDLTQAEPHATVSTSEHPNTVVVGGTTSTSDLSPTSDRLDKPRAWWKRQPDFVDCLIAFVVVLGILILAFNSIR